MSDSELHSIVVPMFNEEPVAEPFWNRVREAMTGVDNWELVIVDDGSRDRTFEIVSRLQRTDPRIRVARLARNFGHQTAITAGIDLARGETVTVIDADLQDPPELIPKLIDAWREGADIVFAVRRSREGDSVFKKLTAKLFYRLMRKMADIDIPVDAGDFRLMSRRAADGLRHMRERSRYIRGLVGWMGLRRAFVEYERDPRFAGETKYPLRKMLKFAFDGIFAFSTRPLQAASFMGFVSAGLGLVYGLYVIWLKLTDNRPFTGWASLMVALLFFGGVQLITLGIVGEYLGRVYDEVRGRPLYLIGEVQGFSDEAQRHFESSCLSPAYESRFATIEEPAISGVVPDAASEAAAAD